MIEIIECLVRLLLTHHTWLMRGHTPLIPLSFPLPYSTLPTAWDTWFVSAYLFQPSFLVHSIDFPIQNIIRAGRFLKPFEHWSVLLVDLVNFIPSVLKVARILADEPSFGVLCSLRLAVQTFAGVGVQVADSILLVTCEHVLAWSWQNFSHSGEQHMVLLLNLVATL